MHEFRHPNIIEISYQEKYSSMPFNLQKPFKAQVSIMSIHNNKFKVDFRLVSGNSKRFVRTCQKIQVIFIHWPKNLFFCSNIWSGQKGSPLMIIWIYRPICACTLLNLNKCAMISAPSQSNKGQYKVSLRFDTNTPPPKLLFFTPVYFFFTMLDFTIYLD